MTDTRVADLRTHLSDELRADGSIVTDAWHDAFALVPRHTFLPAFFRQTTDFAGWELVSHDDPEWLSLVYQDRTWVTQLDGDDTKADIADVDGRATGGPTSSSTAPGLMATMLEMLNLTGDERVLEIGTGTGYGAALLAERLGGEMVTTIDVDSRLTARAEEALTRAGYAPTVVTGDGTAGYPANAPYDRVIATVAVAEVPRTWIEQTRPGGLILTNLFRDIGGGVLVLLKVSEHGTASGRLVADYGSFMPVRTQQGTGGLLRLRTALDQQGDVRGTTTALGSGDQEPYAFLVALFLPGVERFGFHPSGGEPQDWLFAPDGSWACHSTESHTVEEYGSRRLWQEVEDVQQLWHMLDRPTRDRFGLTVHHDGTHTLWLDEPGGGKTWPVPEH